jgi:hypothetical protein
VVYRDLLASISRRNDDGRTQKLSSFYKHLGSCILFPFRSFSSSHGHHYRNASWELGVFGWLRGVLCSLSSIPPYSAKQIDQVGRTYLFPDISDSHQLADITHSEPFIRSLASQLRRLFCEERVCGVSMIREEKALPLTSQAEQIRARTSMGSSPLHPRSPPNTLRTGSLPLNRALKRVKCPVIAKKRESPCEIW